MSFKPKKSRSLQIVKNKTAATAFSVAGQAIPTVKYELVKGFGGRGRGWGCMTALLQTKMQYNTHKT